MKSQLIAIVAAVLVGCGESQQSPPVEPAEPVAEVPAQQSASAPEAKPVEPVAEAAQPEPPTVKAPDISIHEAAAEGNIEAVKRHLASGAGVNARDDSEWTPLHYAAREGRKETIKILIAKGADVNAKDDDGWTPLYEATQGGSKEIVEMLITNGADVNAKTTWGGTPLHRAAIYGYKEIAEVLIAAGADVNAKYDDDGGETPLDLAIEENKKETADLLRKHGGKTKKELKAEEK